MPDQQHFGLKPDMQSGLTGYRNTGRLRLRVPTNSAARSGDNPAIEEEVERHYTGREILGLLALGTRRRLRRRLTRLGGTRTFVAAYVLVPVVQGIMWTLFLRVRSRSEIGLPIHPPFPWIPYQIAYFLVFYMVIICIQLTVTWTRQRLAAMQSIVMLLLWTFSSIIVLFSALYWSMGTTENFNVELSHSDAIYFSLGTLTTAGTGGIWPTSELARGFVSTQMVSDLVFIGWAVSAVVTRWGETEP
jgi:hypothetical protein